MSSGEVFIGAYALIDATIQHNKISVRCKNGHAYKGDDFPSKCTQCNQPLKAELKPKVKPATLYDLLGDSGVNKFTEYNNNDGLSLDDNEFIITSDDIDDTVLFVECVDDGFADKLEPKNHEQYIYAFEAKFADELAALREKANSVDVRFGVLVTWG